MSETASRPVAVHAEEVPPRTRPSLYPEPFASRVAGRIKRPLGEAFGLSNFGVNLTTLPSGAISALRHAHTRQDEFIYVLEGTPTLVTSEGEKLLAPGMCAGFPAAGGNAHHLVNRTSTDVVYLEVGDRSEGDEVHYPDDDMRAVWNDGRWVFTRKDGSAY